MAIQGLPAGIRRKAKETFIAALMSGPELANNRVFKRWITWDSDRKDVSAPATFPAICVQVLGGPVERLCVASLPGQARKYVNESKLTAVVTVWAAGTDAGDVADLGDAVNRTLTPQDLDARTALAVRFKGAGIKDWRLTREIMPMSGEMFSAESVCGQGSYELTVQTLA